MGRGQFAKRSKNIIRKDEAKMRIEHFRYAFKRLNGFYLKEHIILFRKPLELWNEVTGESITFKTLDEVLDYELDGESVKAIIERTDTLYIPPLNGGRGAGNGTQKSFKFGSAGGEGKRTDKQLLPARANVKIKSKTLAGAMKEFREKHGASNREWAYEVDDNGYVHQYVKGMAHSVNIGSRAKVGKGQKTMILHNHPSGGHFSDADLISTAMDGRSKGIVATSTKAQYTFEKGTHFKATQFVKAVKNANMKGKSYDDAVDKWLKANSKKYGYKYTKQK